MQILYYGSAGMRVTTNGWLTYTCQWCLSYINIAPGIDRSVLVHPNRPAVSATTSAAPELMLLSWLYSLCLEPILIFHPPPPPPSSLLILLQYPLPESKALHPPPRKVLDPPPRKCPPEKSSLIEDVIGNSLVFLLVRSGERLISCF